MQWEGHEKGIGIGGWLTNYKRFNCIPMDKRLDLTVGDYEHFDSYITEKDVKYIASLGFDHIRLGFDQIVVEEKPGVLRERTMKLIDNFVGWCRDAGINAVLNLHKAIGNYCDVDFPVSLFESDELKENFIALWKNFAERYKDQPHVAFELLNDLTGENEHKLSSNITGNRVLDIANAEKMIDLYLRRKRGEAVFEEALNSTRNQVYWFGILKDLGY